jgi:hypothetical protein
MVKSIQVRPPTRTIGVQCNLYKDPATVSDEEVRNDIPDNDTGKVDPDYIPEDPGKLVYNAYEHIVICFKIARQYIIYHANLHTAVKVDWTLFTV